MSSSNQQFYKGALILTYAGLLSKVLSAFYRIPLQNITGDTGFYIYQQMYPFIGISMMLALYGLPQSLSRLYIEEPALKHHKKVRQFVLTCGMFMGLILFLLANQVAQMMNDPGLVTGVQTSAILFVLIPFLAIERGFFQSSGDMRQTAISQLIEQLIRVTLIIVGAVWVMHTQASPYTIAVIAPLASLAGGVLAVLYLRKQEKPSVKTNDKNVSIRMLVKPILFFGFVMAINHMVLLLLQVVDAFTLVPVLINQGFALHEAQVLKGTLDRAQPLSQLGIIVASSITLALVPSVTRARLAREQAKFMGYVRSAYRFTFYIASAAMVGLILLMPRVNVLLFKNDSGTQALRIFMVSILFASLAITSAAILQGMNQMVKTASFVLIGMLVKVIFNYLLIADFGISGAAAATVIATISVFGLNLFFIRKHLPGKVSESFPYKAVILAHSALIISVGSLDFMFSALFMRSERLIQFVYLLILVSIGVLSYAYTLYKMGGFSEEEMTLLKR